MSFAVCWDLLAHRPALDQIFVGHESSGGAAPRACWRDIRGALRFALASGICSLRDSGGYNDGFYRWAFFIYLIFKNRGRSDA